MISIGTYRRLLRYIAPYRYKLLLSLVLSLIIAGCMPAIALLVKNVMDDIFIARNLVMLHLIAMAVITIYLAKTVCDYFSFYIMNDIGQRVILTLRDELYAHIQTLSMPYFIRTPTGILISRITNDVNMVQLSVTESVTEFIRQSLTLLGLIVAVFWRDWRLAIIAMLVFPMVIYPINKFGQRLKRYSIRSMKVMGNVMSILDEGISGIRIVKAYNMEEYEKQRFSDENRNYYTNWMKRIKMRALSGPLMELIGGLGTAFLLWYGGLKVIHGVMTAGEFMSFITALSMLYAPIRKLNKVNIEIQEGTAAAGRIFDLLDTKPEIKEKPDAKVLPRVNGDFEFRDVWFSYTGDGQYALEGINLRAERGKQIALVGESGSGKSTMANLLPRFFDVSNGQILVGGIDIREVTLASLRENIAMVTQEMILFNDTIKANIAYGTQRSSIDDIMEAAKAANAHDFIMAQKNGYDTIVGESGVRLSGGQKQRICIARAIIKNAPILILDEATSALDTESEREVQAALDRLMKGRTTLVIAHRLSTIVGADEIIVLSKGRIVEKGTHDDLLKNNGHYARLYALQFGTV
ncbi:MAG TPA: lipid A export permease/ATP-binding protein MsbA [Desulfomonilia bacterium]|nr:lipid A export permease/ATP-binding protein MsbA [Desulfomonilia bacterium]